VFCVSTLVASQGICSLPMFSQVNALASCVDCVSNSCRTIFMYLTKVTDLLSDLLKFLLTMLKLSFCLIFFFFSLEFGFSKGFFISFVVDCRSFSYVLD
jgi:hypothetical protein